MNSRTAQRERDHRKATALAAKCRCLNCNAPAPSVCAHFPVHRGMGGANAGWSTDEWVPLCGEPGGCHDILDRRNGASSDAVRLSAAVRARVTRLAPAWRTMQKRQEAK